MNLFKSFPCSLPTNLAFAQLPLEIIPVGICCIFFPMENQPIGLGCKTLLQFQMYSFGSIHLLSYLCAIIVSCITYVSTLQNSVLIFALSSLISKKLRKIVFYICRYLSFLIIFFPFRKAVLPVSSIVFSSTWWTSFAFLVLNVCSQFSFI